MKANALKQSLEKLIISQIPVFVWGSPGIGKSSIVKQIANEQNLAFVDLRLSLLDPTDLKGIPFFDKEKHEAVWASPNFLPSVPDSKGILFLDEINTAPPSVQASAYQLVLDRKVGDYELPDGWSIVAAGNNESDRGVVYRMPPPLANRFVHLDMEVSFEDWKVWAYGAGIESSIIAFLQYDTTKLFDFDPTKNQKSFPTPRSWEYIDKILNSGMEQELLLEIMSGTIGNESATAFMSFRKVMHRLPNIEKLLASEEVEVEHDSQVLFALIAGIITHIRSVGFPAHEKIDNALKFSLTLPKEFSVMLVKDMQQNGINVEGSSVWEDWVEEFAYLLI
ncbi:MAG TPA: MoxR family ATPase [Campylobacterales bacterium]|nr:MoxR family ATPase [Campylobacterales bacterium]